jgi:rfaE bifunctional protein nucleotidyltransferase chain/domain
MNRSELVNSKIFSTAQLQKKVNLWRFKEQRIVFTNGCFDILHRGHIHLLTKAADLGDVLVVGLNSDESVRKLKGINRPLQDEITRASLLASLFYVSAVVLFHEETPLELIKLITPDILVKGGDYTFENIVGAKWVTEHGGKVEVISLLEGYSTSNIEEKLGRK